MKRIFVLFLCLCTIFSLVACDKSSKKNDKTDKTELVIAENGQSGYTVVRADLSSNRDTETSVALRKILAQYSQNIMIATDDSGEKEQEILVGKKIKRDLTKEIESELKHPRDFIIRAVGDKIAIIGGCDYATAIAVDYFADNILKVTDDKKAYVPADTDYYYSYELDVSTPGTAANKLAEIYATARNPKGRVMVTAHRGDNVNHPENSAAGIRSAIEMGVDFVEVDAKKSLDGVIYLSHDNTLNRMTNATSFYKRSGYPNTTDVGDWTYEQLMQLNLKERQGGDGANLTDNKICTLREAFSIAKELGGIILVDQAIDLREEIYKIAYEMRCVENVMWQGGNAGNNQAYYNKVLAECGIETLHLTIIGDESSAMNYLAAYEKTHSQYKDLLQIGGSFVDHESFWKANDGKVRVYINTLSSTGYEADNKANWIALMDLGIGIIQTNNPEPLVKWIRSR